MAERRGSLVAKLGRKVGRITHSSRNLIILPVGASLALVLPLYPSDVDRQVPGEPETIARYTVYHGLELEADQELPQRITTGNAGEFLSADPNFRFTGYNIEDYVDDKAYFTTRIVRGKKYGVDLVFKNPDTQFLVNNQADLVDFMNYQRSFENGDRRLLAFIAASQSTDGFEVVDSWGGQEASIVVDQLAGVAVVSTWKKYVDGRYLVPPRLMNELDKLAAVESARVTGEFEQGEVRAVSLIVKFDQGGLEPLSELKDEFAGVDFGLYNR